MAKPRALSPRWSVFEASMFDAITTGWICCLLAALPQPGQVLSDCHSPFVFSEFQQNIVSQSYPPVITRSLMLGYSFICHRFHTKHDIPIRCSAGNTIQSLEYAKSEVSIFFRIRSQKSPYEETCLSCWPNTRYMFFGSIVLFSWLIVKNLRNRCVTTNMCWWDVN